jgi:hypothetical protein
MEITLAMNGGKTSHITVQDGEEKDDLYKIMKSERKKYPNYGLYKM